MQHLWTASITSGFCPLISSSKSGRQSNWKIEISWFSWKKRFFIEPPKKPLCFLEKSKGLLKRRVMLGYFSEIEAHHEIVFVKIQGFFEQFFAGLVVLLVEQQNCLENFSVFQEKMKPWQIFHKNWKIINPFFMMQSLIFTSIKRAWSNSFNPNNILSRRNNVMPILKWSIALYSFSIYHYMVSPSNNKSKTHVLNVFNCLYIVINRLLSFPFFL